MNNQNDDPGDVIFVTVVTINTVISEVTIKNVSDSNCDDNKTDLWQNWNKLIVIKFNNNNCDTGHITCDVC